MRKRKTRLKIPTSNQNEWLPLLTISQTAQILNVSPWTLRKWDKEKKLVALRFGNRKDRRYRKEQIIKILKSGMM